MRSGADEPRPRGGTPGLNREGKRGVIKGFIRLALFLVLLLVSAGRLDWAAAWLLAAVQTSVHAASVLLLVRLDPELLNHRNRAQANTEKPDRLLLALIFACYYLTLIVAGLDAGRHQWTGLPLSARLAGAALLVAGAALITWAMAVNTHFEGTVRIQKERNHQVCQAGPYRIVRHPGYTGMILTFLGTPLLLGSCWALVPTFLTVALSAVRTAFEDQTLRRGLEGYPEYARQTKYRLLPHLW